MTKGVGVKLFNLEGV